MLKTSVEGHRKYRIEEKSWYVDQKELSTL